MNQMKISYGIYHTQQDTGQRIYSGVSGQRDDARDEFGIPNGTGSILVAYDKEEVAAVELGYMITLRRYLASIRFRLSL